MENINNLIKRITTIQYQYLNSSSVATSLTNKQKVDYSLFILNGILKEVPANIINDDELPVSFLGCAIDWRVGVTNDKIASVSLNDIVVQFDLAGDYSAEITVPVTPPEVDLNKYAYDLATAMTSAWITAATITPFNHVGYVETNLEALALTNNIINGASIAL
jgi:hypothetical protein